MSPSPEEVDEQVEAFFVDPPRTGPGRPGKERSILFLLRRDLRDLSVPEGDSRDNQALTAPVLAALAIMIGFEILARVYQGLGPFGNRTKADAFRKILKISEQESWLMVDFRDAVAHGYQLVAHTKDRGTFYFGLASHDGELLFSQIPLLDGSGVRHDVNFWTLRQRFLEAIEQFKSRLSDSKNISDRNRFMAALPRLQSYRML